MILVVILSYHGKRRIAIVTAPKTSMTVRKRGAFPGTLWYNPYIPLKGGIEMIKIILCDDDSCFLSQLQKSLHDILKDDKQEARICVFDAPGAIPDAMLAETNLFFLDMDFPDGQGSGIDLARRIRLVNQEAVLIFVTNYVEYAPEGYEVQAFRYLLKSNLDTKLPACLKQAMEKLRMAQKTVQLPVIGGPVSVSVSNILYIESQGHYVIVHTADHTTHKFYGTMAQLEKRYASLGFLRVHKSYLVNMAKIAKYQYNGLTLADGTQLSVSQKNYGELKQLYLQWKGRC
jgi:DNA-binding LytR/AlgR family response regulator